MKTVLIKQPAGIGDILFCQKIAKVIQENTEYKSVVWPVAPVYSYLEEYMGDDDLHFPVNTDDFPFKEVYESGSMQMLKSDDFLYIPLESSNFVCPPCTCHNNPRAYGHIKYNFCNIDYLDWKDYLAFRRFEDREDALVEKLGIDLNEPYNLVNNRCGTSPNFRYRHDLKPENDYKNISMDFVEGFTLFDWCKIFEHAKEIHTMETGIWYILDKLDIEKVYIYSKCTTSWYNDPWYDKSYDDFSYMKDNCNPKWNLIS